MNELLDETLSLFDASLVITYPAASEDDAVAILDEVLGDLEERGYALGPATVEESVKINDE